MSLSSLTSVKCHIFFSSLSWDLVNVKKKKKKFSFLFLHNNNLWIDCNHQYDIECDGWSDNPRRKIIRNYSLLLISIWQPIIQSRKKNHTNALPNRHVLIDYIHFRTQILVLNPFEELHAHSEASIPFIYILIHVRSNPCNNEIKKKRKEKINLTKKKDFWPLSKWTLILLDPSVFRQFFFVSPLLFFSLSWVLSPVIHVREKRIDKGGIIKLHSCG